MFSLGFVGGPNPLGHRTYMGIIYWLPFFLSRTAWRDGWREIGIPTSEGCLWYTLRCWYRLSLEVFHIKYGYYVQAWAARGSKHQQTRKMNSELIRKKLRTNCSNMSFKRKLRCIWYKIRCFSFFCVYLERLKYWYNIVNNAIRYASTLLLQILYRVFYKILNTA